MIINAKVSGFEFQTTLEKFLFENPNLKIQKFQIENDLLLKGVSIIPEANPYRGTACFLTLIGE
jgi:hypothetical protein